MALVPGTRLGPYEVVGPLGAGGMGEVYRARDTKLGREVALKLLPEHLAQDPERLARFEREARTLAALNHPHIAQVYGLEDAPSPTGSGAGLRALVMELVEGPTLAERIAGVGAPGGTTRSAGLPLDEALPIAQQIAEALEAAHDQGIVHRDLKPANIKVRPDGTVKVLDFGLAKAVAADSGVLASDTLAESPTITSPAMTMRGVILGTAAYMSPEQAKGKPVDRRADIWAFGCVLFEMLTGRRAFEGEDVSDTLAFVLTKEPDWSRLPPAIPGRLRRLLQRLLEKDARRRVPDMTVVRWEIDEAQAPGPSPSLPSPASMGRWPRLLPWALAAAAAAGTVAMTFRTPEAPAPQAGLRVRMDLGADASLLPITNAGGITRGLSSSLVLSPDGHSLAFVARAKDGSIQLHLRRLDELSASPLAGTENAAAPFFSPDGQWIAFFADGKLKKVSVAGGAATVLCNAVAARGGSWTNAETIVFAPLNTSALHQVPASGGVPAPLTTLEGTVVSHRWPQALPDGKGVLFTAHDLIAGPYDAAQIAVVPLAGGTPKTVMENASFGRYVASGHLLFVRGSTVYAVAFDLDRLTVTGGEVPIVERVSYENNTGVAQVDVSASGALVYVDAGADDAGAPMNWLDRAGKASVLRATRAAWNNPKFSPDGGRLAMDVGAGVSRDIWVYDIGRDVATRLTFMGSDNALAVWSPDGQYVAYRSNRSGVRTVYAQRADGAGEAVALAPGTTLASSVSSWHPSGRFLAVNQAGLGRFGDIMVLNVVRSATGDFAPGNVEPLVATNTSEQNAKFSPDGRWVAYTSNESGRSEVYVRPFPSQGGKWQISTAGGTNVEWVLQKNELVFGDAAGIPQIVPYSTNGDVFQPGSPTPWPGVVSNPLALGRGWALHPDGTRLVIDQPDPAAPEVDRVTLITGLPDLLRRVAPREK